jgi:hypothetical protein
MPFGILASQGGAYDSSNQYYPTSPSDYRMNQDDGIEQPASLQWFYFGSEVNRSLSDPIQLGVGYAGSQFARSRRRFFDGTVRGQMDLPDRTLFFVFYPFFEPFCSLFVFLWLLYLLNNSPKCK